MKWGELDGEPALLIDTDEPCDLVVALDEMIGAGWSLEQVQVTYAGCGSHEVAFVRKPT